MDKLTLDTDKQVFFYEQDFYVLSNFSAFSINWRGQRFSTTEQAYHWERFWDIGIPGVRETCMRKLHRDFVQNTVSAHEAFRYAQKNKCDQRPDWDGVKTSCMKRILVAKVDQHKYVRQKLLETGDRELVENSWRDDFWGWGAERNGRNELGKLWMEIRSELQTDVGNVR